MDYCTYGYMIDNIVLIVTGTLHERNVQVKALVITPSILNPGPAISFPAPGWQSVLVLRQASTATKTIALSCC